MLTLTRVGQTPLFAETPIDPANHGSIGFLVPDRTPHIPAQLTIRDVWSWGINSRGAGWCLFTPPGQPIPTDQAGASALIAELRRRLPSSSTSSNVGFVWLDGDLRQPASLTVQRLDLLAANPQRRQPNPITPSYEQTYTFKQFTVAVPGGSEAVLKPDASGFEIITKPRSATVQLRIPVAPRSYAAATSVFVPFNGELRGSLQFTLEPLATDKFGYGAIDASFYYYLRPENGSGNPRMLRYPLIEESRVQGAFNFEATFFRVLPQADGTPTPVPSYFRTTAGYSVDLLANVPAKGRFYLRPRPNLNNEITDLPEIYYLAPSGGFEVNAGGPLDDNHMTALLAGSSGTEYLRLRPRNGTAGDLLTFELDRSAYAETFGDLGVGGGALLTPGYQTSWATIEGVGDPADRYYFAQPPDAPLFQANGIFSGTSYLDFSEISIAPIRTAFPLTPVAGVNIEPHANGIDVDTYETFEREVLIPVRDETIKRASPTLLPASPARSLRKLLANGTETEKRTTPQGLVVDVNIADSRYTRLLLGSLDGVELAIDEPTVALQQALASPKVFLVISHLESVGAFTDNTVSMSAWNFVADVAEAATDTSRSVMVMKFADGTPIKDFLADTSRWTDPDSFSASSSAMSTKLQAIVAGMRATANNASTDPDIKKYVTAFLRDVIDEPNWSGTLVFDVSLGDPNEMPREIRGLLPGMVVTKPGVTGYDGNSYTAPTNKIDPAFQAHHLRVDIAKVNQDSSSGEILGIHNSSMSAMINYVNQNGEVNGVTRWKDSSTTEVAPVAEVSDYSYRVKFMRVVFENSFIGSFTSEVTLRFHQLFKEAPLVGSCDGKTSVNSITLSGLLQQIDGIPTYVFRFGCVDPLKNNFIVCKDAGLGDVSAWMKFPDVSPVISAIESTRVDYNMLQISMETGGSNIAEFVLAGYMSTRELDGRDFFSYDRVGFGKLSLVMNYNSVDPETVTDDPAKPEDMGNPFWIFTPNTMKFDSVRGAARDGSIVKKAPLAIKGIAESVSTFSAADVGVFPIPNLVPMSKALIPYTGPGSPASPVTYVISYGMSTTGIGLNVSTGGLVDVIVHTGWKEKTWNPAATTPGEDIFYTALQWGTPLTNLDIGKRGMFKIGLTDFGFGEAPTSTTDRLFFIYVNGLTITMLKWTAKASLLLFAPAPADQGFGGAFGDASNITSWFASFQASKGSSGTSGIASLPRPIPEPPKGDTIVIELASAALDMVILERDKNVPKKFALSAHGWLQSTGSISGSASITVTARLYENGEIMSSTTSKTTSVSFSSQTDFNGAKSFTILFDDDTWPTSDTTYTADIRITGAGASDKRAKTIRQTNTVSLRADEGRPGRSGSPIVEIDYLAIGRGVRLRRGSAEGGDSNLNVRPEMRTVGDALALMQQMLPAGESGPDLYNVLRDIYAPSAGMMVGIDITIMGWLRFAVIANTADEIYGGLIEIKDADKLPSFAQKLAGLRIEILYRRLWDDSDLGVYEGTLILPDALRYWDVGGFSITVPTISLAVYTDGGFLLDLGFPTGSFASGYDYSRSFAIQGFVGPFPVMGAVGIYLGRLTADAEYRVPDIEPVFGVWNSVWKFGFAAKLGLGKSYKRGPLSFEFSLTAQLVFQGISASIDRVSPAPTPPAGYAPTRTSAPSDFLMLEASFQLVLQAMGKFEVRKSGFGLSASLNVKASIGFQFRYMTATPIKIQISVVLEAELVIRLDLFLFSISISFKFEFKFQPTFTIENKEKPDWLWWAQGYPPKGLDKGDNVLTGASSANGARMLLGRSLAASTVTWTAPGALWADGSFDAAFGTFGLLLPTSKKVGVPLGFVAPYTIYADGDLVATANLITFEVYSRALQAGVFVWAAKMILGGGVTGSTTLTVDDLLTIREAIDGERQELTWATLRDFLDASYELTIHPGDQLGGDLPAAVFPMIPDYKLTYGDTTVQFNQQTLRDDSYYQDLDDYLEALLLRVEQQLGMQPAGAATMATTASTPKPLVEHVFEAFFELLVEAGIEDAIEAKAPRAADPSTIEESWTLSEIVRDILDLTNLTEVKPVAGLASRLMLGGNQLPDSFVASTDGPSKPSGFQPLYALTGQQVPVDLVLPEAPEGEEPDPDEVIWTLTLSDADDEELASSTVTRADYDTLTALPGAVQDALDFGDSEPVIELLKPYLERNPDYPIDERVPIALSTSGGFTSTLMPFSTPFQTRLDEMDDTAHAAAKVTRVEFEDEFSNEITATEALDQNDITWALIVPFTAGRVVDPIATAAASPPATIYRKETYTFGGTDELTRARVAALMTDLMEDSPSIQAVHVLHSTTVGDEDNSVSGQRRLSEIARIVKTNLSTVSAPRGARRLAAVEPPEERYYGELNSADLFASLRLLWEASVVNAPGFFLEYEGAEGLPADAFGASETATLSLVILLSAAGGVPAYANGMVYSGRPAAKERFYVEALDDDTKIAIPVGVPGTLAFYAGRDVTDVPTDVAGRVAANTANLFNLMAYRIKDDGSGRWAVGSESWSLPFGPLKLAQEQLPVTIKSMPWTYEIVVPWTTFLTGGRTNSPLYDATGQRSPYDIVGDTVEMELAAFDTFGNKYPQTVTQSVTIGYTDPLISIAQWPEVQADYQVNEDGQIVIFLEFGADRFTEPETVVRARALRAQYETVWFQLKDPNTSVTLHTSLLAGDGEIGLVGGSTVNTELLGWVEDILDFLHAKVTGGTATAPGMKTLTSAAIERSARDARTENINPLTVSVVMTRPVSMLDSDAAARIESVGSVASSIKPDTEIEPDLPELPEDMTGLGASSLVGFAQRFEAAFPELRLATGDSDTADQALWTIRMGRDLGESGPGIRYSVTPSSRSFFANAPLSTRLESCTITDPATNSPVDYSGVDMDKLGRRFVAVVDDMLSQDKAVALRRAGAENFRRLLVAKETVAGGIPNGLLAVFTDDENDARRASARETFRQALLKSLSAAYDIDTIVTYDVDVSNSETSEVPAPNLYGNIVSLDPTGEGEAPFVVGTAKVSLGNDAKLSFTFSTDLDSERAQLPANLAFQVTYVEHDIQTGKPAWAPPTGSYEYRSGSWLKLILPDNTRVLNIPELPNDPLKLVGTVPINVPIPLREIPTAPAVLRQLGSPETAIGDDVTLAQAAAWEYEYQIERPRAAQDRIYLHIAFNTKPTMMSLLADEETLLEALCLFDLQYSKLVGADKPIEEQTQPTPGQLLTLIDTIEKVADKWGSWQPNVPMVEYDWRGDDWAYYMSETTSDGDEPNSSTVDIRLRPLPIKEPVNQDYGNFPEIRVPDPQSNGPQDLTPSTAQLGDLATYTFDWPGALPENQTRSFVFSNLNVLRTENARGRTWLTRNENLGELDNKTTNERFVYRSGASEFTDPLQPFIDRGNPIDISGALEYSPTPTTLAGYLEPVFQEIFKIAIDNGYPWPLTKINCRYGHDPRNLATPVTSPDPDGQFIVHLPVFEHVPFSPDSTSGLANDIQSRIAEWETHMGIPDSPTRGTGFYEFDLSVFSTLTNQGQGRPVLRLRRLWIKRLG